MRTILLGDEMADMPYCRWGEDHGIKKNELNIAGSFVRFHLTASWGFESFSNSNQMWFVWLYRVYLKKAAPKRGCFFFIASPNVLLIIVVTAIV
jgi:hypothetical protein